jgi:hypothetical protein
MKKQRKEMKLGLMWKTNVKRVDGVVLDADVQIRYVLFYSIVLLAEPCSLIVINV